MVSKSLIVALSCISASEAFTIQNTVPAQAQPSALRMSETNDESSSVSRRSIFQSAATITLASLTAAAPAFAAKTPPTKDELARIQIGYDKLGYLLENFDQETTICRENGGECKRDADPVRKYLGLRSTTDPLFQIEKVFDKVKYMDIDPDNIETFFEATEEWNTAVNMSNSMAFISQFGEYNPGGGKDEVLKYLEEAKKQVFLARGALEKILAAIESA